MPTKWGIAFSAISAILTLYLMIIGYYFLGGLFGLSTLVSMWVFVLDPNRCTCGAPGYMQFGMYVAHASDCPARRTEES